jgi:hypothetical protein
VAKLIFRKLFAVAAPEEHPVGVGSQKQKNGTHSKSYSQQDRTTPTNLAGLSGPTPLFPTYSVEVCPEGWDSRHQWKSAAKSKKRPGLPSCFFNATS